MVAFKCIAAILAAAAISADAFTTPALRRDTGAVAEPIEGYPEPEPSAYVEAPEHGGVSVHAGAGSGSDGNGAAADSAHSTHGAHHTDGAHPSHTNHAESPSAGAGTADAKTVEGSTLSAGAIAGIAVGAAAGCALLGGGAYFAYNSMHGGAAGNSASAVEMLS